MTTNPTDLAAEPQADEGARLREALARLLRYFNAQGLHRTQLEPPGQQLKDVAFARQALGESQ